MNSARTSFPERMELAGEGLVLRDWTEADLAVMPELFDHPDVAYWTPMASPFDEAAARAQLERSRKRRAEGASILLAITVDGGAPLGEVMLRRADEGMEIGYAVGPAHRGQGLAARAVRVMAGYAFEAGRDPGDSGVGGGERRQRRGCHQDGLHRARRAVDRGGGEGAALRPPDVGPGPPLTGAPLAGSLRGMTRELFNVRVLPAADAPAPLTEEEERRYRNTLFSELGNQIADRGTTTYPAHTPRTAGGSSTSANG